MSKTADGMVGGITLRDGAGRQIGGSPVIYLSTQIVTRARAMGSELMISGILIVIAATGMGCVLIRLGLRRELGTFTSVEDAIHGFERDAWRSAAGAPNIHGAAAGGMRESLEAAEDRYRNVPAGPCRMSRARADDSGA